MDAKVVAGALFDGSVIALVAAAATVCLDLFGFLNLMLAGAFILGAAEESAFAAAGSPQWERVAAGALAAAIAGFLFDRFALYPLRKRGSTDLMVPALTLVDDAGQTSQELPDGDQVPEWTGYLRRVKPAETLQGNVVFDVPPKHYRLRVTDETSQKSRDIDIPLHFASETPDMPTQQ